MNRSTKRIEFLKDLCIYSFNSYIHECFQLITFVREINKSLKNTNLFVNLFILKYSFLSLYKITKKFLNIHIYNIK